MNAPDAGPGRRPAHREDPKEQADVSNRGLSGTTAIVTGASRGFGRGIAAALSRPAPASSASPATAAALGEVRAQLGDGFTPVAGDAADPVLAGQLIDAYRPATLVLNAGASPLSRPLHRHTWETFSRNWDVDVRHVFAGPARRCSPRSTRAAS